MFYQVHYFGLPGFPHHLPGILFGSILLSLVLPAPSGLASDINIHNVTFHFSLFLNHSNQVEFLRRNNDIIRFFLRYLILHPDGSVGKIVIPSGFGLLPAVPYKIARDALAVDRYPECTFCLLTSRIVTRSNGLS